MKVGIMHYNEIGVEGERKRSTVKFTDKDNSILFKTKNDTSDKLRQCGGNIACLELTLMGFRDIEVKEINSIMVNGDLLCQK